MSLSQLHLFLNHWPIIGTLIGIGLFVFALAGNSDDLKQASLALFSLIALFAIPTYMSGHAAEAAIKETADVSMDLIETHQGAALLAFISMEITGAVALLGLWRFSRPGKNPWMSRPGRLNLSAVLLLSIVTMGLMAVAGNTGGEIRHPEILSGPATTSAAGVGSRIIPAIQYLVIDYSMWVWPILEDLHFLGLILLIGTIGTLNLRVLGLLKQLPIAPLHRLIPWGIAGFVTNLITGLLFFWGMPGFYAANFVFQIKMLTILLAGANLLLFYCTGAFRVLEQVGAGEDAPPFAKLVAASSLLLWFAVIILGRYIPFGEVT